MPTQYTRAYSDPTTGEVLVLHTQDLPFAPGFEPAEVPGRVLDKTDLEIETTRSMRAGELMPHLEVSSERTVRFKQGARPADVTEVRELTERTRTSP